MRWSLSRLRPLHVALASVTYWIGIAAVKLGGAIAAAWQIGRLPPNHGSLSATLQDTQLQLTMMHDGAVLWSGSASLSAIALWGVGPPLLLALTWRWAREVDAAGGALPEPERNPRDDASAIQLPPPPVQWGADRASSEPTRVINPRAGDSQRRYEQGERGAGGT